MSREKRHHESIKQSLQSVCSEQKATSIRRHFPHGLHCIGAVAADINAITAAFRRDNPQLSADELLVLAEYVLEHSEFHEEILIAYGLIQNLVKNNYGDNLLDRFKFWLENYANNWALVDDLCIKTLYNYLLSRPHLIHTTHTWADSSVSWCRRASNVVWVKFIKRKIGSSIYQLNTDYIFTNCDKLIADTNEFVQKSVGWLLKATSIHHQSAVINYIKMNGSAMQRSTIRYALEKVQQDTRRELMGMAVV